MKKGSMAWFDANSMQPVVYYCPVCGHGDGTDVVAVAIHLMERHSWEYEQAADWIREKEEAKCANS